MLQYPAYDKGGQYAYHCPSPEFKRLYQLPLKNAGSHSITDLFYGKQSQNFYITSDKNYTSPMPIKILVIDDEVAMQQLIRMGFRLQIRKNEYEFLFALNGREALQTVDNTPEIDIILCDINMPVMNGLTFISHLKERPILAKTIMVTAYGNMENIRAAMNGGAFDFITKPIDFPDLQITIVRAIEELTQLRDAQKAKKELGLAQLQLELTEEKAKQLRELDQVKSRFFTNISHEFRTPLTVIEGMADQVRENPEKWAVEGSKLIRRNSKRLLRLVSQILDLRKLETGTIHISLIQGNVISYLNYITVSFESLAESKGLNLTFEAENTEVLMDFDPDKLMSISTNLIANAIKYTEKGEVKVRVFVNRTSPPTLGITISDTGIGISEEKLPLIFNRFYQVDHKHLRSIEGTGVGLALTHELVKLLEGNIEVESQLGSGSVFRISLPLENKAPLKETLHQEIASLTHELVEENQFVEETLPVDQQDLELPRLLLVEDNADIIHYLISCVGSKYRILTARDGEEGIIMARAEIPDIIISDVMMPRKDGFELCETLKKEEATSHIPIILLTAKADVDSKLTGLGLGADAYLAKPFNEKELLIRLERLIQARKELQARYQTTLQLETSEHPITQSQDSFILKFREIITSHLDDSNFNVPRLCETIGMSRASLHRKIKALTGLSTTNFIQNIRLQKAEELLQNTDLGISEIAYMTGFSAPAYFSKSYKTKYGVSPREGRKIT